MAGAFHRVGGRVRRDLAAIDTHTGKATKWNPGPYGGLSALAVSGRTLYAGGYEGRINVWDLDSGKGVRSWGPAGQEIGCLAVVAGGDVVLTGQGVSVRVWDGGGKEQLRLNGHSDAVRTIVLAHGAGAGRDTPFMNAMAAGLAERGLRIARFEFPYMAKRRSGGKSGPPDPEPVLRARWLKVIDTVGKDAIIGGKSMGGRMASLVADEANVRGLVCLGYPFHPVGKPERLRTKHLRQFAGVEPAEKVHLKNPLLCRAIPLHEERIFQRCGPNMRNAEPVEGD